LADQQPSTGNMNESEAIILSNQQGINPQLVEHKSSIDRSLVLVVDRTNVQDLPVVKEIGTQTEASIHLSTATINPQHESIAIAYSNQPVQDVPSLPMSNKRSNSGSSQSHVQMRKAITSASTGIIDEHHKFWSKLCFNKSFTYASMKFLLSILLVTMIICQLSTRSMINKKDMNVVPLITRHTVLSVIPVLVATVMPISSSVKGPSRSMLELWFYPFAVP
jgi:hypothetical protein